MGEKAAGKNASEKNADGKNADGTWSDAERAAMAQRAAELREARAGDRWLLCSDGLTDHVMDEEIQRCLALEDMDAGADKLMELALDAGGQDNITLVLLEVSV